VNRVALIVVALLSSASVALAANITNGGFETNTFEETVSSFPDVDMRTGDVIPGWTISAGTAPLASLVQSGSLYFPNEGDYSLTLGVLPDSFPNSALSSHATTVITELEVGRGYRVTLSFAPGYLIGNSSRFGSDPTEDESARLQIGLVDGNVGIQTIFVSGIPMTFNGTSPNASDWQEVSMDFVAPSTELSLELMPVGTGGSNDARTAIYFVDSFRVTESSIPEPASIGIFAIGSLAMLMRRKDKP